MTKETANARFTCTTLTPDGQVEDDGAIVLDGLRQGQKTLPCRFLYDDKGSALFEKICTLAEYYPTRTEEEILRQAAPKIAALTGACELLELGSGSSIKTRLLLDAYNRPGQPLLYTPVDVNGAMVRSSAERLLQKYEALEVAGLVGTYDQAMAHWHPAPAEGRLVIFLGSTIGNFPPDALNRFLAQLSTALKPGHHFLLGADLHKDPEILRAAYNDAKGVTAAFNLNILRHLNRRFGSNFVLENFRHDAVYDIAKKRIEMHLQCLSSAAIHFTALDTTIKISKGETIRTEISRKFEKDSLMTTLGTHGFSHVQSWSDPRDWFTVQLYRRD